MFFSKNKVFYTPSVFLLKKGVSVALFLGLELFCLTFFHKKLNKMKVPVLSNKFCDFDT
jgi:hypothetical protein